MKRSKPLKADPERVREWQQRSRRKRTYKPRKRKPPGYEGDYGPAVWKATVGYYCECCGKLATDPIGHHVVEKQHVKQVPQGLVWDVRNRMTLNRRCHERHHSGIRRIELQCLPSSAFEFAAELLGPEKAYEYLRRRYDGEDERLDALIVHAEDVQSPRRQERRP